MCFVIEGALRVNDCTPASYVLKCLCPHAAWITVSTQQPLVVDPLSLITVLAMRNTIYACGV